MSKRTWFKLYCEKWLTGTIRKETPVVRSVFIDLLALAGAGEFGDVGIISLKNGVGITDLQFEKLLNISKKEWWKAKGHRVLAMNRFNSQILANCPTVSSARYGKSRHQHYLGIGVRLDLDTDE